MATYSYKGYDFEVDHDPSPEEFTQMSAYVDSLPPRQQGGPTEQSMFKDRQKQILPDLAKNAVGVAQAGMDMVGGIPGFFAGIGTGVGTAIAHRDPKGGLELAKEIMGKSTPSALLGLPTDNAGYQAAMGALEKVDEALVQLPAKGYGEIAKAFGGDQQLADDIAATAELGLMGGWGFAGGKKAKGAQAAAKARLATKPKAEVPSVKSALEAIDKQMEAPLKQGELFPETLSDPTGHASPYDASTIGTTEPITPKRARAQQELPLRNDLPESINVDREGVTLRPEDMTAVEAAKNAEVARLDQEAAPMLEQQQRDALLNAKQEEMWATDHPGDLAPDGEMAPRAPTPELTQQGELFAPQTNMHRDYTDLRLDDGRGGERPLTKAEFEQTLAKLEQEKGTAFTRPEDVDAAYADYMNSVNNPSLFDTPARQEAYKAADALLEERERQK